MLEIDGSLGEGGGQIIRTSLTLSLATGQPFRIYNIRAGRAKPGLLKQHLAAMGAAAEIGDARTKGAELRSRELTFSPSAVKAGDYRFSIGTAGSTTLVLQTVLPVLLTAGGPSTVTVEGGTHNAFAPPFDFLQKTFLPLIGRMGPHVSAKLDRPGFYPAGGGKFRVSVQPVNQCDRLELLERGDITGIRAAAVVSKLPRHIAERELKVIKGEPSLKPTQLQTIEETRSPGPGNVVMIEIESAHLTEVVTVFGQRGVRAESVARKAISEAQDYIAAAVPVGSHLVDQLLVPLSLGSGGSFRTFAPTQHTLTNIEVIRRFLDVSIECRELDDGSTQIDVHV